MLRKLLSVLAVVVGLTWGSGVRASINEYPIGTASFQNAFSVLNYNALFGWSSTYRGTIGSSTPSWSNNNLFPIAMFGKGFQSGDGSTDWYVIDASGKPHLWHFNELSCETVVDDGDLGLENRNPVETINCGCGYKGSGTARYVVTYAGSPTNKCYWNYLQWNGSQWILTKYGAMNNGSSYPFITQVFYVGSGAYGVDQNNHYYKITLNSGTLTDLGQIGQTFGAIAANSNGHVYWFDANASTTPWGQITDPTVPVYNSITPDWGFAISVASGE